MAQNRDEQEIVKGVGNITLQDAPAGPEQVPVPVPEPEPEPEPEPTTRAGFLRYYRNITLDPDTVHRKLILSEDDRKARRVTEPQPYPDHPNRFTKNHQVLSNESLTGRQYWEVDLGGLRAVVAVAYGNISRTAEGEFRRTEQSWALCCSNFSYTFWHNNEKASFPSSIGVYLDHSAGTLSFYRVDGDTMSLLYRVRTTFTEPLHAGVGLGNINASAEFIHRR